MSPTTIPGKLVLQSPAANDPLLDLNTQPSLDLQFATSKTLDDRVSGLPLVDHQRDASGTNSSGTYVGSDGLIKNSAVNLFTYSEQFDQWTVAANSVITPNALAAPDGTLTADKIYFAATGSTNVSQSVTLTQNKNYTFSVYAKAVTPGSNNKFVPYINSPTPKFPSIDFEATSEWQRFTYTFTHTNTSASVGVFIANKSDAYITNVYLWGAQLEESSTATDYIPTTTTASGAPRFDHDPITNESLGLLIEEARTNVVLYSEDFSNAAWNTNNLTAALSTVDNPFGVSQTWRLTETTGTATRAFNQSISPNPSSATLSIFVKPNGRNWLFLQGSPTGGSPAPVADRRVWFDLTNKTVGTVGSRFSNAQIQELSDGWLRVSAFLDFSSDGSVINNAVYGLTDADGGSDYTGNGSSGVYVWGAQRENNATFPTSYIPTSGTTVTRAADVAEITGANFSSFYNQTEGTFFGDVTGPTGFGFTANGGSDANRHGFGLGSGRTFTVISGVSVVFGVSPTVVAGSGKFAHGYKANDYGAYGDGVNLPGTSPTTVPTGLNELAIGYRGSYSPNSFINGHISRLTYYPYRLGDTKLQEITS